MRILIRIVLGILLVLVALVLVVIISIPVDAALGSNRVAAMVNTTIENPAGPPVAAYVAQPAGEGPFPAVIMLHEFWGLKPEIVGKADALAAEGYVVVAPDMYRGQTTTLLPRAIYLALNVPEEQVLDDLEPVFAWLAAQPNVDPERIVVMGFCYGGGKALQYSLRNAALAGTGVFYGALETDPDTLKQLPGPVLGSLARRIARRHRSRWRCLQRLWNDAGVPHDIKIYDGVGHAFVTDMESIRRGGVQGEAWNQFMTWLDGTVGDGQ